MSSNSNKHLHELLQEDQEPFQLKTFIADRRTQLKTTTNGAGKTSLHLRKQKPIIKSTLNHVCFFTFHDSPDYKRSPFLDFPAKSPCNNPAVFLNVPARTAAMLLDAASRVQKSKPRSGSKSQTGLGLLGSFLRRLKDRSIKAKRRELGPDYEVPTSPTTKRSRNKSLNSTGDERFSYWSEKSSEMETSCSSRSIHELEENECFCSNPSSPFRFSLQRSPSPTHRKIDLSSPVESPSRHFQQDKESYEVERPQETHRQEDDEKEQCSPVSVLDPLFDEDEEERDCGAAKEDCYDDDTECSYAIVQRAKHQLLLKLQRFERLAGLDPINLEKYMLEQQYDEDDDEDVITNEEFVITNEEFMSNEEFVREIVNHLGVGKIPWYMKKLVLDLIEEENKNNEPQVVVQRVCKRLHSWKVVELNTIDMMVETDFRSEGWKRCDEEKVKETGMDIEVAIFGFLVDELVQELVNFCC
ncbi:uncharacterized protein [Rutidosis leptorrhynchoides]|uniref:uncharacterized protein n=1 Tax=Rutidosis leptorrhynchoides TaxID=125765 RepID=UPI003A99ADD9